MSGASLWGKLPLENPCNCLTIWPSLAPLSISLTTPPDLLPFYGKAQMIAVGKLYPETTLKQALA